MIPSPENPYERREEFSLAILVANGDNDLLVPTGHSFKMQQTFGNAQLIVYLRSGHGLLFQYAELSARHVEIFLDGSLEEAGEEEVRKAMQGGLA